MLLLVQKLDRVALVSKNFEKSPRICYNLTAEITAANSFYLSKPDQSIDRLILSGIGYLVLICVDIKASFYRA